MHGHPRATKDIDFLISTDDENLNNLSKALIDFGGHPLDICHIKTKGNGIRFGVSPIMIEIINEASGISIEDCYSRKEVIVVENTEIPLISKSDLIINKKSAGRYADLADVETLENK
jgi:hypothetical protein